MKHDPMATANAAAVVTASVYVICRALVWLVPDWMFTMGQSWLHGIQLTKMVAWNLTAGAFVLGLVSATVFAWLAGWCFAHCYNYFLKK